MMILTMMILTMMLMNSHAMFEFATTILPFPSACLLVHVYVMGALSSMKVRGGRARVEIRGALEGVLAGVVEGAIDGRR